MRSPDVRFFLLLSVSLLACGDDSSAVDATVPDDVGMDGQIIRCETANDCSDGLFCTGEETCAEGICVAGEVVDCDDDIECTIDGCNEISNSCESLAPDLDGDGSGDSSCVDALGEPLGRDCDDTDVRRFGGNLEVCDLDDALEGVGLDEDCDPTTFGAVDSDGDSYFDDRCFNIDDDGVRAGGDDCSDGRGDVNPGTAETCDHRDNNCDGNIDEGVVVMVAPDADRDGFPVADMARMECPGFAGLVAIDDDTLFDCDDTNPAVNPGQLEICDEIDNNCNDLVDDDTQIIPWYRDTDGDGFGSAASGVVMSCEPVANATVLDNDCNDDDAAIHPASAETCDGIDQDCNGRADFEISPGNFEDDDEDGSADIACGAPRGVDCDDEDANTGGGTPESCDGRDNDCDMSIDEGATEVQWFYDGDRDGHGTNANPAFPSVFSCSPPAGYVGSAGDCNDMNPARSPDATEDCNGVDDDCDGALDEAPAICDCPVGTMDCDGDGSCETRTDSNLNNCGGCRNVDIRFDCEAAPNVDETLCISGSCFVLDCANGFDDCSPEAPGCETDVSADIMNCDECGRQCVVGNVATATCSDQECAVTCAPGFVDCGDGQCSTPSGPFNCGSCGRSCGFGQSCVDDMCVDITCMGDESLCGEECRDLSDDAGNCGGCGRRCPDDALCVTGDCQCNTSTDEICGNTCVDTATIENCGGCGITCGAGQSCTDGRCECGDGEDYCDGACVTTDSDPLNCGGCGFDCGVGGVCSLGICDPVIKVVQGLNHTCALRGGGNVVCWGGNGLGQVDPSFGGAQALVPRELFGLPFAIDLSAGDNHTCIVSEFGDVWCWGANGQRQLGRSTGGLATTPLDFGFQARRIYAGSTHTCAATDTTIQCWGDNGAGQTGAAGDPAPLMINIPEEVSLRPFSEDAVLVGSDFSCFAGDVEGMTELECVGVNDQNQSGTSGAPPQGEPLYVSLFDFPPAPVPPRFSAGDHHACGVLNGTFDCWGSNDFLQCNSSGPSDVLANDPQTFPFSNAVQCVTRANATCVLTNANEVWCAGENADGGTLETLVPGVGATSVPWTRVSALGNAVQSLGDGGRYHSCAIAITGRVFCWGKNSDGQLGTGSTSGTALAPTRVFALTP